MRISRRTHAQDGDVFQRQTEARLQLGISEINEPHADALLARIVPGPNEFANQTRPRRGKARWKRGYRLSCELNGHDRLMVRAKE